MASIRAWVCRVLAELSNSFELLDNPAELIGISPFRLSAGGTQHRLLMDTKSRRLVEDIPKKKAT
jgi:hypothetical protein